MEGLSGANGWVGPTAEPPVCPPGPAWGFGTCLAQTGDEAQNYPPYFAENDHEVLRFHIRSNTERPNVLLFIVWWKLEDGPIVLVPGFRKIVRIEISERYPSVIVVESVIEIQTNPKWSSRARLYHLHWDPSTWRKLMSPLRERWGKPFSQETEWRWNQVSIWKGWCQKLPTQKWTQRSSFLHGSLLGPLFFRLPYKLNTNTNMLIS